MQDLKNPKVSIIIVTYNNEKWVKKCLDSLLNQDYVNTEIIWVDNGSKDKTLQICESQEYKSLNIKIIRLANNSGFAGGNNEGVKHATGEIIFLLNVDTYIEKDTILNVVKRFEEDKNIGIVQNKIVEMENPSNLDSGGSFMTFTGFLKHKGGSSSEVINEYEIFSGKGASLFLRSDIVNQTFLFSDTFHSYFEDTDLCWRAWLLGYKVIFFPNSVTYHKGGSTAFQLVSAFVDFNSFKNRIQSLIINYGTVRLLIGLPVHTLLCFGISFFYLLRGRFSNSFAILKALWWNVVNIRKTLRVRKAIQSKRKISDKELFSKVGESFKISYFFKSLIGYTGRVEKEKNSK